ncbi:MAG: hypothetical protein ABN490_22160, partial [Pantoea agglomerans]
RTLLPRAEIENQASSFPLAGRDSVDIVEPQKFLLCGSLCDHRCPWNKRVDGVTVGFYPAGKRLPCRR